MDADTPPPIGTGRWALPPGTSDAVGELAGALSDLAPARYDSRPDTWEHISQVQALLMLAAHDLHMRGLVHDWSKLLPPEVEVFDEYTPRLAGTPYDPRPGSAYQLNLAAMKPALDHHYAVHDHHPEHFGEPRTLGLGEGVARCPECNQPVDPAGGVFDMTALQIVEMCADWIAASRRHPDGDVVRDLPKNADRFGYAGTALERTIDGTVRYLLAAEAAGQPPDA